MTESFNAYHEWLGLDPALAEPNHYELLAVEPYLAETDRLSVAADRALAKVRGFRPGAQAPKWSQLLDRLTSAKNCLLDPTRKAEYDQSLRQNGGRHPTNGSVEQKLASPPPEIADAPAPLPAWNEHTPVSPGQPLSIEAILSSPPPPDGVLPNRAEGPSIHRPTVPAGYAAPAGYPDQKPTGVAPVPAAPIYGYQPSPVAPQPAYPMPTGGYPGPGNGYAPSAGGYAHYPPGSMPASVSAAYPGAVPTAVPAATYGGYSPVGSAHSVPTSGYAGATGYSPALAGPDPMAPAFGSAPTAYPAATTYAVPNHAAPYSAPNYEAPVSLATPVGYAAPALPLPGGPVPTAFSPNALATSAVPNMPDPMAPVGAAPVGMTPAGASSYPYAAAGTVPMGVAVASSAPAASPGHAVPNAAAPVPADVATTPARWVGSQNAKRNANLPIIAGGVVGLLLLLSAGIFIAAGGFGKSKAIASKGHGEGPGPKHASKVPVNNPVVLPQPEPQPSPETRPNPLPRPESRPEPTPEPKPQPETKPLPETKPEPPPVIKPEMKPEPKPEPVPEPKPEPKPEPQLTPQELATLGKALSTARLALSEGNLDDADAELIKAEPLAKTEDLKEKVERLKSLAHYVREFWRAVDEGRKGIEGGADLQVSSTFISVVEPGPGKFIYKANGQVYRHELRDLPGGIAMMLAKRYLKENDPTTKVVIGAYHAVYKAVDKKADARRYWEEAQAGGADVKDLLAVLDETYDLAKDAPKE